MVGEECIFKYFLNGFILPHGGLYNTCTIIFFLFFVNYFYSKRLIVNSVYAQVEAYILKNCARTYTLLHLSCRHFLFDVLLNN